ncbi:MAG: hypothetical protein QM820_45005 [Minicystis sp.]
MSGAGSATPAGATRYARVTPASAASCVEGLAQSKRTHEASSGRA